MEPVKEALISNINFARGQMLKLVADLTDDQLAIQPGPGVNHPAWVLGHMYVVEYSIQRMLSGGQGASADPAEAELFGGGSKPLADRSKYKTKAYYLEKLSTLRAQTLARLNQMTMADLLQQHPDPARRDRFPTIYQALMFYGVYHETYHAGQLSTWRRVQGLPPV